MSFSYPKRLRVRTRRQFQRIAHQATRYVGDLIIIESCPNKNSVSRLGITASRRYGKSVERNRFKRIVREAFRLCYSQLKRGLDINIKPRQSALAAKTADVQTELLRYIGMQ